MLDKDAGEPLIAEPPCPMAARSANLNALS